MKASYFWSEPTGELNSSLDNKNDLQAPDNDNEFSKLKKELLYRIEIVNITGKPITFNIKIEKSADYSSDVNLRWPISGFTGKTEKERYTVALLPKIRCQWASEIEQLRFNLDYQLEEPKI